MRLIPFSLNLAFAFGFVMFGACGGRTELDANPTAPGVDEAGNLPPQDSQNVPSVTFAGSGGRFLGFGQAGARAEPIPGGRGGQGGMAGRSNPAGGAAGRTTGTGNPISCLLCANNQCSSQTSSFFFNCLSSVRCRGTISALTTQCGLVQGQADVACLSKYVGSDPETLIIVADAFACLRESCTADCDTRR